MHPNPPRLITVAIAIALAVVGLSLALPIPQLIDVLRPILQPVSFGVALDAQLGWLLLFASTVLLVAGSLLPGI
jgi:hypothetical protein